MITFDINPNDIDFTGNGLGFELTGEKITTEGARAYVNIIIAGAISGYFKFRENGEIILQIDIVATPDPEKNEIQSGLTTAEDIADALNAIYAFNEIFYASIDGDDLKITTREKAYFVWEDTTVPTNTSVDVENYDNGAGEVSKSNYAFNLKLYKYESDFSEDICEMEYQADISGSVEIAVGDILKSYVEPFLPDLEEDQDSFDIFKYTGYFAEKYDVSEVSTICAAQAFTGYALRGKIDLIANPDYDLLTDIASNKIFLNTFSDVDIYTDANYFLNLINPAESAGTLTVVAKIYYTDETDTTEEIYTINTTSKYQVHIFNAGMTNMDLNSYNPDKEIYKYEVWVIDDTDAIVCDAVLFRVIAAPVFKKEFAFLNKFGVMDIFHAYSKEDISMIVDKNIVKTSSGSTVDSFIEAHNKHKVSTGGMCRAEALEIQYMLMSEALYEVSDGEYIRIIVDAGTLEIVEDSSNISIIEFSYRKSTDL